MKKKVHICAISVALVLLAVFFYNFVLWEKGYPLQFDSVDTAALRVACLFAFGLLVHGDWIVRLFSKKPGRVKLHPLYLLGAVILFLFGFHEFIYYRLLTFDVPRLLDFSTVGFGGLELIFGYASAALLTQSFQKD